MERVTYLASRESNGDDAEVLLVREVAVVDGAGGHDGGMLPGSLSSVHVPTLVVSVRSNAAWRGVQQQTADSLMVGVLVWDAKRLTWTKQDCREPAGGRGGLPDVYTSLTLGLPKPPPGQLAWSPMSLLPDARGGKTMWAGAGNGRRPGRGRKIAGAGSYRVRSAWQRVYAGRHRPL